MWLACNKAPRRQITRFVLSQAKILSGKKVKKAKKIKPKGIQHFQHMSNWSCFVCSVVVDCGLPGPFHNGYLDGQHTTFGSVITFRCFGRTTFEGESTDTTCQENGEWSHPLPRCWSKFCVFLPFVCNEAVTASSSNYQCTNGKTVHFLSSLYIVNKHNVAFFLCLI